MASSSLRPALRAVLPVPLPPTLMNKAAAAPAGLSVRGGRARRGAALVAAAPAGLSVRGGRARRGAALVAAAGTVRPEENDPEGVFLSGEWPGNSSSSSSPLLLGYVVDAELRSYLESRIGVTSGRKQVSGGPTAPKLMDVMSRPVQVATPGQRLGEVDALLAARSGAGLPVVDGEGRCVGVVSNKDRAKATNGMESTVGEVMSSPAISLTHDKTVLEAAALMLKEKVHMIPVVNQQRHVIGIVTRTDILRAPPEANANANQEA